ncbi:hypothetical protein BH18ACT8_BH18ACT8_10860 [soil metagenome]
MGRMGCAGGCEGERTNEQQRHMVPVEHGRSGINRRCHVSSVP